MSFFHRGAIVEAIEDIPGAPHPTETRDLLAGDRFKIDNYFQGKVEYSKLSAAISVIDSKFKLVPTVGGDTARDELDVAHFRAGEFFVFRRRDSALLCQVVQPSLASFKVFRPIIWETHSGARRWIDEGCLADLQEGLGNLTIGFTTQLVIPEPKWPPE